MRSKKSSWIKQSDNGTLSGRQACGGVFAALVYVVAMVGVLMRGSLLAVGVSKRSFWWPFAAYLN